MEGGGELGVFGQEVPVDGEGVVVCVLGEELADVLGEEGLHVGVGLEEVDVASGLEDGVVNALVAGHAGVNKYEVLLLHRSSYIFLPRSRESN